MSRFNRNLLTTESTEPSLAETGSLPARANPPNPRYRAALINPPDPSSSETRNRWIPPLGLAYIASVARNHEFHVDLFDFSRELKLCADTLKDAGCLGYPVYGISSYSETWSSTVDLITTIRAHCPHAFVVVGGYHASIMGEEVLRGYPAIDLVVRNEGEEPFTEVLIGLSQGNREFSHVPNIVWRGGPDRIVSNPGSSRILDVDRLPHPVLDYKYFPQNPWYFSQPEEQSNKRTIAVVSSRGCPKRCSFCSIIVLSPDYRVRSVESLMAEIRHRYAQEPFGHVAFMDANFFVKVPRSVAFAKALYEFNPSITWSGTATADQVCRHAEVLRELGALNCAYLEVGIESGNANSLERFNKKTKVSQNQQAISLLRDANIGVCFDFIMFDPEMTVDDLAANTQFLEQNEFFGYWPSEFVFQELRLFPGTPLRATYEQRLNVRFAAHEMPTTPFFDPAVRTAWRCMSWYRDHYHARVNRLIRNLVDPLNRLMFGATGGMSAALVTACQRGHVALVHLKHLAFQFLQGVLSLKEELCAERPTDEIVRRLDLRAFDTHIEEARSALTNLMREAREEGLEDVALRWSPAETTA